MNFERTKAENLTLRADTTTLRNLVKVKTFEIAELRQIDLNYSTVIIPNMQEQIDKQKAYIKEQTRVHKKKQLTGIAGGAAGGALLVLLLAL